MNFSDLGIEPRLVKVLQRQGITEPFEVQRETIPDIMLGKDVCCRAPTGSGKTLAFGLPLVSRCKPAYPHRPSALVLTPTRELAEQISSVLVPLARGLKHKVLAVYGGTPYSNQRRELERGTEIIVACPGRLIDLMERGVVNMEDVKTVVIDEADRMADMGFIDPVCHILDHCAKDRQTTLFSATLDDEVADLITRYQHDPVKFEVGPKEVSMESMRHFFWLMNNSRKSQLVSEVVQKCGRGMVFCRTRAGVDRVGKEVGSSGLSVATLHGGLSQNQRDRAMERFIYGDCAALIATDVAARGIDVEGVQMIIHYDPPENGKAYKHRSGRTARAGARGTVVSLVQNPQRKEYVRIQRMAGVQGEFTPPDFAKLPENKVAYIPPARQKKKPMNHSSPSRGQKNRGRPTYSKGKGPRRNSSRKNSQYSPQKRQRDKPQKRQGDNGLPSHHRGKGKPKMPGWGHARKGASSKGRQNDGEKPFKRLEGNRGGKSRGGHRHKRRHGGLHHKRGRVK